MPQINKKINSTGRYIIMTFILRNETVIPQTARDRLHLLTFFVLYDATEAIDLVMSIINILIFRFQSLFTFLFRKLKTKNPFFNPNMDLTK